MKVLVLFCIGDLFPGVICDYMKYKVGKYVLLHLQLHF